MSIPTVNSLALSLMKEVGEDVSNSDLVSQFETWIQDVYDEIGVEAEWEYLWEVTSFTTVNGQKSYDLALTNPFSQEIAIQNTVTQFALFKKKRQELVELNLNLDQAGEPEFWYVEPQTPSSSTFKISLYRVPTSAILMSVQGLLRPLELSSTTQLPFPRQFVFLLRDGVRMKIKEDDKDYVGADRIKSRYQRALAKLKQNNDTTFVIPQMQIVDIATNREKLVKLDPNHFRN